MMCGNSEMLHCIRINISERQQNYNFQLIFFSEILNGPMPDKLLLHVLLGNKILDKTRPYIFKANVMCHWMKNKIRQYRSWEIWCDLVFQKQVHVLCLFLLVVKDKEEKCLSGYIRPSAFYSNVLFDVTGMQSVTVSCVTYHSTVPRVHRSATWFKVCIITEQQSDCLKMHFVCAKWLLS